MPTYYEYRHTVGFEETNLVGNVYFANHILWQGHCREMFLKENVPDILAAFTQGLALITTRVSCDYSGELFAFDEVLIRMRLGPVTQNRITMLFEYLKCTDHRPEVVARGEQQVAVMQREGARLIPVPIPENLKNALKKYSE